MLALAGLCIINPGQLCAEDVVMAKKKPVVVKITPEKKLASATESFKKDFPKAKFSKIEESGIEGLYEVTTGANIIFYAPSAGRIIFGEMLDKTGTNITAEKRQPLIAQYEAETARKEEETAQMIDSLPLDKAIRIGKGKNIVVEFTDIDCPYCRKAEEFFKNRDDITRYIFLLPLEQLHPQSMAKSREVLCSKDPAKAYTEAMDGELDKKELKGCGSKEKEIERVLAEHKAWAGKMGVTGTPMMWVNKKQVNGADMIKIGKYLASGATGTK
jgi:thiol:disulfide interchange protein DsbC